MRYTKPGLSPGFFLLAVLCACGGPDAEPLPGSRPAVLSNPGRIEDPAINEASGIVYSPRGADLLWVHNDSGAKARLYAIDPRGKALGRIKLDDADNKDWEDIAAVTLDGRALLVVADIGDNDARRKKLSLYVVAEPELADDRSPELKPEWRVDFRYPDGPHDAEAIAVDADNDRTLILTKRDLPPRLYGVSLSPESDGIVDAALLGLVETLPRPSRRDVAFAPKTEDWYWQPTAMDIAPDGSALVVLTYSAVYYYSRSGDEDWLSALKRPPLAFDLGNIRNAEAIAFGPDSRSLFVTVEKKRAPLFRIDMPGARSE